MCMPQKSIGISKVELWEEFGLQLLPYWSGSAKHRLSIVLGILFTRDRQYTQSYDMKKPKRVQPPQNVRHDR